MTKEEMDNLGDAIEAEWAAKRARVTACVNALAGLNPSALAGLIEAAEEAVACSPFGWPCADNLKTALANLRGDGQ